MIKTMKIIKPSKLKKGDKVAIVSLSSGILGEPFCEHQVHLGVKRLNEMGLEVVFMPYTLKGVKYIKENPKDRAGDLKSAYMDESIKAIICAIGGDDTYKILPYLINDKEFVSQVKMKPKIFLGFSDSTNNHFMFYKLGVVSYYGLNFLSDLAELEEEMLPYTKQSYLRLFENPKETVISSSEIWYKERKDYSKVSIGKKLIWHKEERGYEVLRGNGKINGKLFGGCLESIYSMLSGDRYPEQKIMYESFKLLPTVQEWQDKILFLETSEEKPNTEQFGEMIDLLIANGIIKNIRALVIGKPQDEYNYDEYKKLDKGSQH
jgi:muramoyltetrapeptide carboxypeptidase LdcA involved in peptidoglycan recycling